jgi:hypothetical protein
MPLVRYYSTLFQDQLQAPYIGGVIVSSTTIHNEMLAREAALLGLLYGNFLFDRRGEEVGGQPAYFVSPI